MSVQGQELHVCCSEIAGDEGIPLCHLAPLGLLGCLLPLLSVSRDAVPDPGVLLHLVLAELCPGDVILAGSAAPARLLLLSSSSPPVPATSAVCGGSFVNTAVATSWSVTLGREESSSRPLKCVDLQLISKSLDFFCQETWY